jgi:hypothetical protein
MWIDAICIHQDNHIERGHQVEQMEKVYTQAKNVVCWLGLADDNSELALKMLNDDKEWKDCRSDLRDSHTHQARLKINQKLSALL